MMNVGAVTVWVGVCVLFYEQPMLGAAIAVIGFAAWRHYKKKHTKTSETRAAK
jgi:hypothetical protein